MPSRWYIGLAVAVALVLGGNVRVDAGVVLVGGSAVRRNVLPPFLPMPDGTVLGATEIILASQRIAFTDATVLVYNTADGVISRYGETSTLALESLGMLFAGSVMIADPRTLTLSAFANQDSTLREVLDQPGFVVMVEVGPGTVPASALSIRANDVNTPTPRGAATRTPTPSRTFAATGTPTATGTVTMTGTPRTATPTGSVTGASPTPTSTVDPAQPCRGDCNNDRSVTVDELVRAVNIALETLPVERCRAVDADANQFVTVNELVGAVGNALRGCGG